MEGLEASGGELALGVDGIVRSNRKRKKEKIRAVFDVMYQHVVAISVSRDVKR